jgi:glutathione synthase/RimK-type ligase-like ATP-grasp enzyme
MRSMSVLNADVSNATNKRRMRELFSEAGVPAPRLFLGQDADEAAASGTQLIGRPDQHWKGRGFWRVDNTEQLAAARAGTRRKRAATHFMEFIDTPHEFRVHVFGDRVIRLNHKNTTAFHEWTSEPSPFSENDHLRQAAKAAITALGLHFGAVDILADESQAWVLEVNTAPGLGGTLPAVYARAIKRHFPDQGDTEEQG